MLKKSIILVFGACELIGSVPSSSLRSDENILTDDLVYKILEKVDLLKKNNNYYG